MIFTVRADGWMELAGGDVRCALGAAGVCDGAVKREGDLATPAGVWPFRRVLYRPDRAGAPVTRLPITPIAPGDGWCDDPGDTRYNQPVQLPYPTSAEALWREDALYDLMLIIGHNDAPVVPGAGSAIFVHLAHADFRPTQGCVALARENLERLLEMANLGDAIEVVTAGQHGRHD
jgi:L,D-peptidoglycan transpeptidase YkuD (ErfK/YbiS/YcfS/YnhG family)